MAMAIRGWAALLAFGGLGVSLYLTLVHYSSGAVPLACSTSGPVNCEQVTTSGPSNIGPLPVALLGVVWFLVMLGLIALERSTAQDVLPRLELAWTSAGLLFVLYLIFAELFLVGALCLWCTAVHVLTVALFLLTLWRSLGTDAAVQPEPA